MRRNCCDHSNNQIAVAITAFAKPNAGYGANQLQTSIKSQLLCVVLSLTRCFWTNLRWSPLKYWFFSTLCYTLNISNMAHLGQRVCLFLLLWMSQFGFYELFNWQTDIYLLQQFLELISSCFISFELCIELLII